MVRVKGHEPVNGCLIGVLTPSEARCRMREIKRERKLGIMRPDCRPGEIVDVRSPSYDLSIQLLCVQAGLDPDDCTDYDYVELTVRAAAMSLARKITLMRRHKKRAHSRPVSVPIKAFDPFEL